MELPSVSFHSQIQGAVLHIAVNQVRQYEAMAGESVARFANERLLTLQLDGDQAAILAAEAIGHGGYQTLQLLNPAENMTPNHPAIADVVATIFTI